MSDPDIAALVRQAPLSFIGTVEHLGAATMTNLPIDARTAVVRVDFVLHAPPPFQGLVDHRVTVQLSPDVDPPAVGDSWAFFARGLAFGESLAVTEVGRVPVDQVQPIVSQAMAAGEPMAFSALERDIATEDQRAHAAAADAVILARVVGLERARIPTRGEHDPDWWIATMDVFHVEKGNVPGGQVAVLYANSLDVQWRSAPKPKASQGGMWLLHATTEELASSAPFVILHPEDFQATQDLDTLRGNGG